MGMCHLPSKILDVTELLATGKTPDQQAGAGVSVNHLLQDYRWQPRNSPAFPTGCTCACTLMWRLTGTSGITLSLSPYSLETGSLTEARRPCVLQPHSAGVMGTSVTIRPGYMGSGI